ncbi:AAA family ATPase [Cellulosilyticum lentocellum]|uniref:ATPase associated with various cellular activities AAA_3 n=1 Tax=Cellulosilyticum lentocellum (strain ATCC 49066 / DSM 5427 / NCIMB 11756 / RHM5) TaxID=642492 RepID=F2JH70_CELLD|nr:MoxR family ATPase [Cellulosilyticum lentocellum]ADZ81885.1 ATPase associated with various cellular activities AAA_3 [Cellulosilyticum lentocellum DSM 5427]
MNLSVVEQIASSLKGNMTKVIKGKDTEISKLIMALLCNGHILLEDIPGTGKTTSAKALAKSLGCQFKRVQFTPDLLPSDLMGINFYNQKEQDFIFKPGPIFTHILLADEINRATPRTQSSLLECMEEAQVTVDGITYSLEAPFLVIATQNPIETQGTFPLPEAQLDRFFMRLSMGYPSEADEINVLSSQANASPLNDLQCVVTKEQILEAQAAVKEVKVSDSIKAYIVAISNATRQDSRLKLGLSLRGSLAMFKASKAFAAMAGRDYVIPDDVKAIVKDVALHRVIYNGYQIASNVHTLETIFEDLLSQVPVPIE